LRDSCKLVAVRGSGHSCNSKIVDSGFGCFSIAFVEVEIAITRGSVNFVTVYSYRGLRMGLFITLFLLKGSVKL